MLNRLQKRNNDGFTIIEVMIVLAIAALILLIVLLAVPALQRNSRNTQIKNDVGSVTGGISTYQSDNDGTTPTVVQGTGTVTIGTGTPAAPTNTETFKINGATVVSTAASAPTAASFTTTGAIQVYPAHTCSGTSSSRAFAIYFNEEQSGGPKLECVDG